MEAANAKLRAALEEKEVLLRELHHRVKSNLQAVSGLLSMQATHAPPGLRTALQDAQERIPAMGRVHEQLHVATDVATVSLETLLRDLCDELGRIYGATQRSSIACEVEVPEPVEVSLDLATPLAPIANEVVSNAFKHAFPEGGGGIVIRLERRAEGLRLEISDDGRGLTQSDGSDTAQPAPMGLRLVELLAQQLDAVPTWHSSGGTTFVLLLPNGGGEMWIAYKVGRVVGNLRGSVSQCAGEMRPKGLHSAKLTADRESTGPSPGEGRVVRVAGGPRVPIVDDELIIAWQLGEVMRELGYEVCGAASDGETAQRLAAELVPDLILMDVRLRGGRDGIEVAAVIRAERAIPIVFCTVYADDPATRRRLAPLAAAGVAKPIRPESLRAALTRAVASPG